MADFKSAGAFADTMRDLQAAIERQRLEATEEMVRKAERHLTSEARRDLGGDTAFSGWRGRDLADLRIKQSRQSDGHWIFPTRKSGGPWKVAEQGRNQGNATGRGGTAVFYGPGLNRRTGETSYTKTGKVRTTRFRNVKRWNGYTAGKGTASRAVAAFEADAERVATKLMRTVIARHFD